MQNMDQFSVDLTRALEETSRTGGVQVGRWGQRRRTRSTGNLPCAPQPTEDSSSSPTDAPNDIQNPQNHDGLTNSMLSDSDDRHDLRLSLKSRHAGNFESDSLNENFSPARFFRPNTRRKRKLKRMAVEYETTPSTPGAGGPENASGPVFPIAGAVKKRVLKHTTQENHRANLFFCGKRKRSHRDRYYDHHDHGKLHSSSVPRQRDIFAPKNSYQEHKTRTRSFSSTTKPPCERILPLNKSIVSKIERISAQQRKSGTPPFSFSLSIFGTKDPVAEVSKNLISDESSTKVKEEENINEHKFQNQVIPEDVAIQSISQQPLQKSDQYEKTIASSAPTNPLEEIFPELNTSQTATITSSNAIPIPEVKVHRRKHKHHRLRREQMRAQLQFDDPNSMECGGFNDFLSSSSLSSSDSEASATNESDREGDDELTDWPGNEAMINFASKNDFKRKSGKKSSNLPQIKSDEYAAGGGDDDTLMSGDEVVSPSVSGSNFPLTYFTKLNQSQPITIAAAPLQSSHQFRFPVKQIESEMSGETSNHFLSSPPYQPGDIREIRAGCRRIREERPGFTIMTSVNERLARFLQDARQSQIRLPDLENHEHESLKNLANLYSLQMTIDNGCAVLTKTSNTTQSVKIAQPTLSKRLMSDFKRRCYSDFRNESTIIGSRGIETIDNLKIFDDDDDNDIETRRNIPIELSIRNSKNRES